MTWNGRAKDHMITWEYLFLRVLGHNKGLSEANNMLVTTSDVRWNLEKMPKNVPGLLNGLGAEGWELIASTDGSGRGNVGPGELFEAIFKRPKE